MRWEGYDDNLTKAPPAIVVASARQENERMDEEEPLNEFEWYTKVSKAGVSTRIDAATFHTPMGL